MVSHAVIIREFPLSNFVELALEFFPSDDNLNQTTATNSVAAVDWHVNLTGTLGTSGGGGCIDSSSLMPLPVDDEVCMDLSFSPHHLPSLTIIDRLSRLEPVSVQVPGHT